MSAPVKPEKRKPLTRRQFAELVLRQEGRCGCGCGKKLRADRIIDEHLQALDHLGSNDLSNRSLWDRDCSKAKNKSDAKATAKGRRLRGEVGARPKRKIPQRANPWPPKGQRGFNPKLRLNASATLVRGEP